MKLVMYNCKLCNFTSTVYKFYRKDAQLIYTVVHYTHELFITSFERISNIYFFIYDQSTIAIIKIVSLIG